MSVHDGAKKILRYLLDLAIEHGNLRIQTALQYDNLAKAVEINEKLCRVCCQYLESKGSIAIIGEDRPYLLYVWGALYGRPAPPVRHSRRGGCVFR